MSKKRLKIFLSFLFMLFMVNSIFGSYSESPMLMERVKNGDLPSVDNRLPIHPKVVKVREEIGKYGGTLHISKGNEMRALLVENTIESTGPIPVFDEKLVEGNVIESWKVMDNGKKFLFTIRKGLKWSDGYPVTTEDVRFTLEDIYSNKNITRIFPDWLVKGGEKVKLNIIDKYTFELDFKEPYGLFLLQLQSIARGSYHFFINPSHYLKKFHAKYTSMDKLKPLLEKEKLDEKSWGKLFQRKWQSSPWNHRKDIGYPVLDPYVVVEKPSDNVTIFERNPYYFKVDEKGNQLPYIDKVRYESISNQELMNMKIMSGELDFTINTSLGDLALYKANEEKGKYNTVLVPIKSINTKACYFPNLTYEDKTWRKIMRNPEFRHALSLAINRDEINELVYYGFGTPSQACDAPGSPFVEKSFRNAYIKYDPKKAEEILDKIGLSKKDKDGWRIGPDGKPFTINIEFFQVNPSLVPTTELVASYWKDIGIKTEMKVIDGGLWYQRQGANKTTMSVWHEDASRPGNPFFFFVPYEMINWGPAWRTWFTTNGKEGEEPPLEVKKLFEYYNKFTSTISNKERIEFGKKILKSQSENLWVIGTVNNIPIPVIINKHLKNVVNGLDPQWGPSMEEQYFFDNVK
ncbi:peptide ABC transporter substrate-binding protein [Tepiditoga spiralis]|uniref:Peptide ABC transporter substrate-binding protein n=1 Tax=Tepiditoga spiralis TaxID=2108365 RepID=A0A7G1GBY8_9BACT|nr:ABC transporter substrate-binding protein [Tepiditoga spiralis]BBE31499.1 peptide ABC transporter substrate-binding protein [Tepiditoga spiralis]